MSNVRLPLPCAAYTGKDPYIFISYAHDDGERVYPEIKALHELGYKIWYDEGIEPGKEWPQQIAQAIDDSAAFLVFISKNSIKSKNVKNEIDYALDQDKSFLAVYLEDLSLPGGLQLRMGNIEAVKKWAMDDAYYWKKIRTVLPQICLNRTAQDGEEGYSKKDPEENSTQPLREKTFSTAKKLLTMGIILALLINFVFARTFFVEPIRSKIVDTYLKHEAANAADTEVRNSKVAFIAINPNANPDREKNVLTPRDQVAEAIQIALEGHAKVIFADFNFNTLDFKNPGKDAALRNVLKEIGKRKDISLILPAEFGSDGLKKNVFGDVIERTPNIYQALSGIAPKTQYPVSRYWWQYQSVDFHGKREQLLGVPLLAAILAEGTPQQLKDCQNAILTGKGIKLHLKSKQTLELSADRYLQRMRFLLIPQDVLGGTARTGNMDYINDSLETAKFMKETFKDKIVIIGNSNPDFGDTHQTPVGKMAGMYIIGNAIDTLLTNRQIIGVPLWLDVFCSFIIIIMMTYLFTFISTYRLFRNIKVKILTYVFTNALILLLFYGADYFFYIHYGFLMNSIMLILSIGFCWAAYNMIKWIISRLNHQLQWRGKNEKSTATH